MDKDYDASSLIFALATPLGRSALAVIRLSGVGSISLLQGSFSAKLQKSHQMVFGRLIDQQTNMVLDEVMIAVFLDGGGYTGEESAEIFCHGNPHIIQSITQYLGTLGFRLAQPGEFSYRAVANGKMSITQAEAVHELITAQTSLASQAALHRLSGRLQREMDGLYYQVIDRLGAIEAYLDYPEEELDPFIWISLSGIAQQLGRYLQHEPVSQILQQGAKVVIAGEPNVGKSSLFNWLLGDERAIVSPLAGTTRDYIEATIDILGYPVRLIDTAGLRESAESIEQQGIERSYQLLEQADVIVYMLVAGESVPASIVAQYNDKMIVVQNKCEEANSLDASSYIALSVHQQQGLATLLEALVEHIDPERVASKEEEVLLGSVRQRELVVQLIAQIEQAEALAQADSLDLVALTLRRVCETFNQFLGRDVQEDAMSAMFRQFCLGK